MRYGIKISDKKVTLPLGANLAFTIVALTEKTEQCLDPNVPSNYNG